MGDFYYNFSKKSCQHAFFAKNKKSKNFSPCKHGVTRVTFWYVVCVYFFVIVTPSRRYLVILANNYVRLAISLRSIVALLACPPIVILSFLYGAYGAPIVALALSTATFAWYTASGNVAAKKVTIMTAKSNNAVLALDAEFNPNSKNGGVKLSFDQSASPMIPKTDLTIGNTTYSSLLKDGDNYKFSTVEVGLDEATYKSDGINAEASAIEGVTPIAANGTEGSLVGDQNHFYLINTHGLNDVDLVNVKVTIDEYAKMQELPEEVYKNNRANYYVYEWQKGTAQDTWQYVSKETGEPIEMTKEDAAAAGYTDANAYYFYTNCETANYQYSYSNTGFFVKNNSAVKALRVAVFAIKYVAPESGANTQDPELLAVWGGQPNDSDQSEETMYFGTIKAGENKDTVDGGVSETAITLTASGVATRLNSTTDGAIGAGEGYKIGILAWYDGETLLTDDNQTNVSFTVEFNA